RSRRRSWTTWSELGRTGPSPSVSTTIRGRDRKATPERPILQVRSASPPPARAPPVDLAPDPGQDQESDPVRADLAVRLDHGALGGVREPGGQPHAGQGALDPAEEAAGRAGRRGAHL